MSENPYKSPETSAEFVQTGDDNGSKLWRDGDLLVMNIREAVFPRRCVKTNEPVEGSFTPVDVNWIPDSIGWNFLFGLAGDMLGIVALGFVSRPPEKRIRIDFPLSRDWRYSRAQHSKTGWRLIIGGMVSFALIIVIYFLALELKWDDGSAKWFVYALIACPLISISGAFYLILFHGPIAILRKMNNDFAWISRVNRDFLASLPEWPI